MKLLTLTVAALFLGPEAAAQLGGERALLLVDPTSDDSLHVANVYAEARRLPGGNVLHLDPDAADYASLVAGPLAGVLGEVEQRSRGASLDFVVLGPSDQFRVAADGLVSDSCVAVRHFGLASAYGLYDYAEPILGPLLLNAPSITNPFHGTAWLARTFRGADAWLNGAAVDPSANGARRLLMPARLGWTGDRGNSVEEVLAMIVRSVGADGTEPMGTAYFMQTTDVARSGPRHAVYPTAAARMATVGGSGEHLFDVLPLGRQDAVGIMTGWATPDIDGASYGLVDGAFCDHLTSFAGHFGTDSQTKMSRWIANGASGTSGAVEEPCNYASKFPHPRVHTTYRSGAALGEAWLRSMRAIPLQTMFLGDPLTRPWPRGPAVTVPDAPTAPVAGVVTLTPVTTPNGTTLNDVGALELFVDGELVDRVDPGLSFLLDTAPLVAGPHSLLVRAEDDTLARHTGSWAGTLEVAGSVSVTLSAPQAFGDLGTSFALDVVATGANVEEIVVRQLGRVVASTSLSTATLELTGRLLGAGPVRLVAEATFEGGLRARSQALLLDVAPTPGSPSSGPPVAFGYRRELRALAPFVLDLPATFASPLRDASYSILRAPSQGAVVHASGSAIVIVPDPGAHGVDLVRFQVSTPGGVSSAATIQIVYPSPVPAGGDDVTIFCRSLPNGAGAGARLGWSGSTSLAADDLILTAAGLPTQSFAIAFRGQGFGQAMVGGGTLCSLGTQVRLAVVQADVLGDVVWPVVQSAQPGTLATSGATWGFQLWYRDSVGAGSGFSDGLAVTFRP